VRRASKKVVAIGACATAGGIQALRNFANVKDFIPLVYATPDYIKTLNKSTPIADHVFVDFELRGCPINKAQLLEVIAAIVHGRKPVLPAHGVCMDCKRRGIVCVSVAHGLPCLGPVTHTGCDALCPGWSRGCFGCFGPKATPNTTALAAHWTEHGTRREEVVRLFRTYNASAEAFRRESEAYES
jgi:coenzyme F420-reducing hydrogenase gamma subunit